MAEDEWIGRALSKEFPVAYVPPRAFLSSESPPAQPRLSVTPALLPPGLVKGPFQKKKKHLGLAQASSRKLQHWEGGLGESEME